MSDDPKRLDPFKPQEPTIPGVTGNPARAKPAPEPPLPLNPAYRNRPAANIFSDSRLRIAVAAIALVVVIAFGFVWHSHSSTAKNASSIEEPAPSAPAPGPTLVPEAAKSVPIGPGPVATPAELFKPWSSKRFVFRAPRTADDIPAMVVHLPGNVYWGFSLREPFGTCQMQYITDLAQIESEYRFTATHPMVVDPCNRAVYDLSTYGAGPNGVVRGAIVHGAGVRPPLAIEMGVRGKQIVALRIEQ